MCWGGEWVGRTPGRIGKSGPFFFRSLFLFDGGWSSGAEQRFTPETFLPPCFGKQKGLFLWGAQWRGRRLWMWAMCQGCCCCCCCSVCFPSPSLVPLQIYKIYPVVKFFDSLPHDNCTVLTQVCSHLQWCLSFFKSVRCHWGKKVTSLKTSWVIWRLLDMLYSGLKYQTKHICGSSAMPAHTLLMDWLIVLLHEKHFACAVRSYLSCQSPVWYTQLA